MARIRLFAVLAGFAALLVVGTIAAAGATSTRPDKRDRALIARLDAKVTAFRAIAASKSNDTQLNDALDHCAALKKDPGQAFAAVFALLPALLADLVTEYKPELTDLHDTLAGLHPDSALFRQWASAEAQAFGLILRFDNHGKKIDYCAAAGVLLSKKSTPQQVRDALGLDPALIGLLFSSGTSKESATLKRVNPKMRAFLRAGGVSAQNAKAMTS